MWRYEDVEMLSAQVAAFYIFLLFMPENNRKSPGKRPVSSYYKKNLFVLVLV